MPMAWQVGLVSVGSDSRNHMIAQTSAAAFRNGVGARLCPWEVGKPTSLIRSFPIPPLSPTTQTRIPCVWSLANAFPCLQAFVSSALALGTRYVRLLPSYVIDGGYLHGPRRAAVGVAVKPPDEGFRRLETTSRTIPYPVPTHTVYDPNPWRGMTDGCSRQVVSLGPYLVHRHCSPPLRE